MVIKGSTLTSAFYVFTGQEGRKEDDIITRGRRMSKAVTGKIIRCQEKECPSKIPDPEINPKGVSFPKRSLMDYSSGCGKTV
ncbi:unnamed protein product [Nezara viridula]|uniref:Uncharacterized protein n=1 Tax=Nezara viridula TaxID=85310 RepID=A0A9P0H2J9_NEZVI|nr:unnamed protein product [Nezara viridula]